MLSLIDSLIAALRRSISTEDIADDDDDETLVFIGANGAPIRLNGNEVAAAINAELLDGAAAKDEHLVYEEDWEWPIDLVGLRAIIAMAHAEPDPDMALISVVLHRGFHEYNPEFGNPEEEE